MIGLTDFERMEREGWSTPDIAKGYADGFAQATREVADVLCDAAAVKDGDRALDLCCGHGVVSAALVTAGAKVTGLDFSPAMVALAKDAVPDAEFVEGDATATEYPENSFDAVTIGFGIPHVPDPAAAFDEVARVSKPGGRLAFSIWQGRGSPGTFGWLFEAYGAHYDPGVTLPEGPDAHAFADMDVACAALAAAGFTGCKAHLVRARIAITEPEDLFDVFDQGAVRAAVMLSGQSARVRDAIRAQLADAVRAHAINADGLWHVPAPAVVVSAILD